MRTFLGLLLALIVTDGYAQVEWAPVGAKWWYGPWGTTGNGSYCDDGYSTISVVGDTIINGTEARVLSFESFGKDLTTERHEYIYSDSDRVYYYDKQSGLFERLYGFGLSPGDTLVVYGSAVDGYPSFMNVLDSIDTVVISGVPLRRQYLSPVDFEGKGFGGHDYRPVLEFIGDAVLFFGSPFIIPTGGCWGGLRCYEDHLINYKVTLDSCDRLVTGANLPAAEHVTVSPNPSNGWITVSGHGFRGASITGEVLDFSGRLLAQTSYINSPTLVIGLHGVADGMYLLRLTDEHELALDLRISISNP